MHVAFVTPEFLKDGRLYPGGLATYTYATSKALSERGVRVSVYLPSDSERVRYFDGIRVIEVMGPNPFLLKLFVKFFYRMAPIAVIRAAVSWRINRYIAKNRRRENIDVIHYTNWKAIGLFRVKRGSLIRISSYERLWDNHPSEMNLDKRLCRWLESLAYKRFTTVIGPGTHLASLIRNELKLQNDIRIVPTPLGTYKAASDRRFAKEGCRLVMYAGTVSRIKGSELLLAIIEQYIKDDSTVVFLIAGKAGMCDGRNVLPDIEKLSSKHPSQFIYHPHLEKEDLMAAYRQANIVLIPSLIDNFPNTALEAASQGPLLIASETASLGSLLRDEENAIILSDRSTATWVDAIKKGLNLPADVLGRMSENLRDSLKQHISENAVDKLLEVYEEVLIEK